MASGNANQLRARLTEAWPGDRASLRARVRGLEKRERTGRASPRIGASILQDLEKSAQRWAHRKTLPPERIRYPSDLPVSARRDDIRAAIRDHQVVVVCGETGSGKTTQLPKIALELGLGVDRLIGHTQPRRIAARAVGARLAEELALPLGRQVGVKVRFDDRTSDDTLVKLMTDGLLLAETQNDRNLDRYECLIIDEAHERSLNIDFLLGYLRRLLPKRPDLRLIITSATIDPDRFAGHFAGADGQPAPIINVSGRAHPVEVRYRPLRDEPTGDGRQDLRDTTDAVLDALDELAGVDPRGDVLVFMPGEREIRETAKAVRDTHPDPRNTEVVPLYARLSPQEQQRVFRPHTARRIVVATNVAETSLTVPGIAGVIDPGTARMSRYSARTKVQGLPVEAISRASADQRKGRCGRVGPGTCIRLYSEEDFEGRDEFTQPEILRTNLAAVVLQMTALSLGRPEDFPFVEPPDTRLVRDGYDTLEELGALDEAGTLTDLGRKLARLPIDPRVGRMVLAADAEGCLHDVLIIASFLSAPDPRDRPADKPDAADEAHERFAHADSDFLSALNIWDFFHEQRGKLSRSKLEKACRQNFLNTRRIHEWREIYRQISGLAFSMDLRQSHGPNKSHAPYDAVHRALLAGLVTNVGKKGDGYEYKGCRGGAFHIHPGSGQFGAKPKWVLAGELVRTTRLYARTVAKIDPAWIEQVAPHLVRASHTDPRWDPRSARVVANERVSLLGLDIVPKRVVHYGPIDPVASREQFIHHGLLEPPEEGGLDSPSATLAANRALVEHVRALEARSRRRDLLAETQARFDFYDHRLPPDVCSGQRFDRWIRKAEKSEPGSIRMTESDLLAGPADEITPERYPDHYQTLSAPLPLEYAYDPGAPADGVTLRVPVGLLGQIRPETADRLVPGLLEEKVGALIRTLPRSIRRNFDAGSIARELAPGLVGGSRALVQDLAELLGRRAGAAIRPDDFRPDDLESYLHLRYLIVDVDGSELGAGRDLAELRAEFADRVEGSVMADAPGALDRSDLTDWDFGDLPESVELDRGGVAVTAFPALVDQGETCALRLFDTEEAAQASMRAGLARLYVRNLRDEFKYRVEHLPGIGRLRLHYAPLGPAHELDRDLMLLIADRVFVDDRPSIASREAFAERIEAGWDRLTACTDQVATLVDQVLGLRQQVSERVDDGSLPANWRIAVADCTTQMGALCPPGFLASTPHAWLRCFPRYFGAILKRFEKLRTHGADRDRAMTAEVHRWTRAYDERRQKHRAEGVVDPALAEFRWLTEELRVSLFAQELGTAVKVSPARMEKAWERVRV